MTIIIMIMTCEFKDKYHNFGKVIGNLEGLEQRIDERRNGRPLGHHDQCTQQHHDNDDGGEPEFFAFPHEVP